MIFWNFIKAWIRYTWARIFGYEVLAEYSTVWNRTVECEVCEFYDEGACSKCGCIVISKASLNTEKCPVGKWERIWVKKSDKRAD